MLVYSRSMFNLIVCPPIAQPAVRPFRSYSIAGGVIDLPSLSCRLKITSVMVVSTRSCNSGVGLPTSLCSSLWVSFSILIANTL